MSMRYALGAKRWRLLRSCWLRGACWGSGCAADWRCSGGGRDAGAADDERRSGKRHYSAAIDMRVLLFTAGDFAFDNAVVQHCAALHFMFPDLAQALRQNAARRPRVRSGSANWRWVRRLRSVFSFWQRGMFVRSLDNLRNQPLGFETPT